jgi:hypothetical protein
VSPASRCRLDDDAQRRLTPVNSSGTSRSGTSRAGRDPHFRWSNASSRSSGNGFPRFGNVGVSAPDTDCQPRHGASWVSLFVRFCRVQGKSPRMNFPRNSSVSALGEIPCIAHHSFKLDSSELGTISLFLLLRCWPPPARSCCARSSSCLRMLSCSSRRASSRRSHSARLRRSYRADHQGGPDPVIVAL